MAENNGCGKTILPNIRQKKKKIVNGLDTEALYYCIDLGEKWLIKRLMKKTHFKLPSKNTRHRPYLPNVVEKLLLLQAASIIVRLLWLSG